MVETNQLSKDNPIFCEINSDEQKIIVEGIDIPGILSQIVGLISVQRIVIEKANSSNHTITSPLGAELACFKDEFIINTEHVTNETWDKELPLLIENQYLLIYKNKQREAAQKIIENISVSLTKQKDLVKAPPVLDITLEAQEESKELEIVVHGEDSPFLLYMLTCAIETQSISIIEFSINTKKGYIEDIFRVTNPYAPNSNKLASLRFKLMLNTQFAFFLQNAPDPYNALLRFQDVINNVKVEDEGALLNIFLSRFSDTDTLAEVLGSGDYLWELFIRAQANEITKFFSDSKLVNIAEDPKYYAQKLSEEIASKDSYEEKIEALNKFKDDEIYLIDLDAMLRHNKEVKYLSERLSELARVVLRQATELSEANLQEKYGFPYSSLGVKSDWALFGLGKFGGTALGYASDIELMFIYEDLGYTNGNESISNSEYFEKFVKELGRIIKARSDGIFKLDVRLRPHGDAGPLAVRLDSFIEYYQSSRTHSIELLALTRMRPVAGTPRVAERVLRIKKSIIYESNSINRHEVFEMRKKQRKEKVKKGTRNAKFGSGTLVDIEYGVQLLQIRYGKDYPALMQPSIHNALYTLQNKEKITQEETLTLVDAYQFYRKLINALRMRRGSAKDLTLPAEHSWELEHLARRMGYSSKELSAGKQLIVDFDTASAEIEEFIKLHFSEDFVDETNKEITNPAALVYLDNEKQAHNLLKSFVKPAQALQSIKNCARSKETRKLFSRVLLVGWVRIIRNGDPDLVFLTLDRLTENLDNQELLQLYKQFLEQTKMFSVIIDIFSTSRFLSEEIIKKPEYISMLMNTHNIQKMNKLEKFIEIYKEFEQRQIHLELQRLGLSSLEMLAKEDTIILYKKIIREFRKQETLQIIVRDIFIKIPLPKICSEISYLAITLIRQALEYSSKNLDLSTKGIGIFAFGKLGAHELNYSSDIDIICVYNQSSQHQLTQISELFKQTVQYLADYTAAGIAYRVDLRLRPFGDGGEIVSHVDVLREYYLEHARLWELQAALKLSAVAGDEALVEEVNEIINFASTQRLAEYKPHMIQKEVHALRKQSVNTHLATQNETYEVKNSWGGIRDIEFGTQTLQLLHYHKDLSRLNTVKALQYLTEKKIISKTTRNENTENYFFLRRVEHFLQVFEDKQLHAIPQNNSTVLQRLAWLMMQEQDEDSFLQKLAKVKAEVHKWYASILIDNDPT